MALSSYGYENTMRGVCFCSDRVGRAPMCFAYNCYTLTTRQPVEEHKHKRWQDVPSDGRRVSECVMTSVVEHHPDIDPE